MFDNMIVGAGEIRLRSADPRQAPHIDFRYLSEKSDRARLVEGVILCQEIVDHPLFDSFTDGVIQPATTALNHNTQMEKWITNNVTTSHHASGTCKMGPATDPMAVVDQHGRIHCIDNLRVVDASIMPDCVRANINATILMMAEKMADVIREA